MKSIDWRQITLILAVFALSASQADAQNGSRRVKQRPKVRRPAPVAYESPLANDFGRYSAEQVTYDDGGFVGEGQYIDGGFVDDGFVDGECGCDACMGDSFGWSGPCGVPTVTAGIEFTFLQPHFESNPAVTQLDSDGAGTDTFNDIEFDFQNEFSPRVWLDFTAANEMGIRVVWWEFDHDSDQLSISPPANGFGRISQPPFGDVDLSTTVPDSVYNASSELSASTIDLEGTRGFNHGCWKWLAAAGLRYAEIEQTYSGDLTSAAGDQQGTINFRHQVQGIGPTLFARAQRPIFGALALFGSARGSLLFGDSESQLNAVEDLDLDDQLTTVRTTARDDLMPIGEMQVGLQVLPPNCDVWHPYFHVALEAQYWGGVGNASSEDGSMGFFGGNVAVGVYW